MVKIFQHLAKGELHMGNNYTAKCSIALVIKKKGKQSHKATHDSTTYLLEWLKLKKRKEEGEEEGEEKEKEVGGGEETGEGKEKGKGHYSQHSESRKYQNAYQEEKSKKITFTQWNSMKLSE